MNAVLRDGEWSTRSVTHGGKVDSFRARTIMRKMADAAWICGDPVPVRHHYQRLASVHQHEPINA
jgi:hypothetical protein